MNQMTSERPSFNRSRNSTASGNRNQTNGSGEFDSGRGNGSQADTASYDESPEVMCYLLSTLIIPSFICFLFVFFNFIRMPQLRQKSSNFLIIALLIINFIHISSSEKDQRFSCSLSVQMTGDLPVRLYYLSRNLVPIQQPVFCLLWAWFDNLLTTADLLVVAFTSLERYLFVFHHNFVRNHKRLLSHLPLLLCLGVPTIWYSVLIFAYPCRIRYDYNSFQCGTLCYIQNMVTFLHIENFGFFIFPLLIVFLANISLIISVLVQKRHMKRQHRLAIWRNNLRMISQLMFIAMLYMSVYIPSCILLIFGSYVRRGKFQPWALSVRTRYFTHLKYLVIFGCPFVILAGQREMYTVLKRMPLCYKFRWQSRWKTNVFQ